MINSLEKYHIAYRPVDLYTGKYYIVNNIPAKPLPQGKLNYGGSFYSKILYPLFNITPIYYGKRIRIEK